MNSLPLCLIVCLALFVSTSEAIKCYVCNSAVDKTGCSTNQTLSATFLKDCSALPEGPKYVACRKIDQEVPNYDTGDTNVRVIRECSQENAATQVFACAQRAGLGGRQYVCNCDHDGCNAGANIQMVFSTLFTFAVVALLGPKFLF